MKDSFNTIVIAVFAFFAVIGIVIFAVSGGGSGSSGKSAHLTLWGTLPQNEFSSVIEKAFPGSDKLTITYVQKQPDTFVDDIVESIASGSAPDMIIMSQTVIYRMRDKLSIFPAESISARTFKDTFAENAEIFNSSDGTIALPIAIDPLLMYWNRDQYAAAGIAQPPKFWDEFYNLAGKLTRRDQALNIIKSGVALGEFDNIDNAKEIISTLLLQAGVPVVKNSQAALNTDTYPAGVTALTFYTDFANPASAAYSWNKAKPQASEDFSSGNTATYFGLASELPVIRQKNPNLNFDIASLPQVRTDGTALVFGNVLGVAVLKSSPSQAAALGAAITLAYDNASLDPLLQAFSLAPARRDLLAQKPADAYRDTIYQSALISRSWLDPNPQKSDNIFRNMVRSITTGQADVSRALLDAHNALGQLLLSPR